MTEKIFNVLILCTGNSARSQIAECVINRLGRGRFKAYSAGSQPQGQVHPLAIELLERDGYRTDQLRSKSWDEFAATGAPPLDFIITVCDNAANEVCPVWPGQPMTAHWPIPDPAACEGDETERRQAFAEALQRLTRRIDEFIELPLATLEGLALQKRMDEIGQSGTRIDETVGSAEDADS